MFWKENTGFWSGGGKILLYLYIILSFVFIVLSFYNNMKMNYWDMRFSQWYSQAIGQVFQKSQTCEAFDLHVGTERAYLINVSCLQTQATWWTKDKQNENINQEISE